MRRTREIETEAGDVTVKEMTVAEIRAWLRDIEKDGSALTEDAVGAALLEEVSFNELQRMIDGSVLLDSLSQSDLCEILSAAKELNPYFFGMRGRLIGAGEQVLRERGTPRS